MWIPSATCFTVVIVIVNLASFSQGTAGHAGKVDITEPTIRTGSFRKKSRSTLGLKSNEDSEPLDRYSIAGRQDTNKLPTQNAGAMRIHRAIGSFEQSFQSKQELAKRMIHDVDESHAPNGMADDQASQEQLEEEYQLAQHEERKRELERQMVEKNQLAKHKKKNQLMPHEDAESETELKEKLEEENYLAKQEETAHEEELEEDIKQQKLDGEQEYEDQLEEKNHPVQFGNEEKESKDEKVEGVDERTGSLDKSSQPMDASANRNEKSIKENRDDGQRPAYETIQSQLPQPASEKNKYDSKNRRDKAYDEENQKDEAELTQHDKNENDEEAKQRSSKGGADYATDKEKNSLKQQKRSENEPQLTSDLQHQGRVDKFVQHRKHGNKRDDVTRSEVVKHVKDERKQNTEEIPKKREDISRVGMIYRENSDGSGLGRDGSQNASSPQRNFEFVHNGIRLRKEGLQETIALLMKQIKMNTISPDMLKEMKPGNELHLIKKEVKMPKNVTAQSEQQNETDALRNKRSITEGMQSLVGAIGPWGSWSSCNSKCGLGLQQRFRECLGLQDKGCVPQSDRRECFMHSCQNYSKNKTVTLHQPAKLHCQTDKGPLRPSDEVYWIDPNGEQIFSRHSVSRRLVGLDLVIDDTLPHDVGIYHCIVKRRHGEEENVTTSDVRLHLLKCPEARVCFNGGSCVEIRNTNRTSGQSRVIFACQCANGFMGSGCSITKVKVHDVGYTIFLVIGVSLSIVVLLLICIGPYSRSCKSKKKEAKSAADQASLKDEVMPLMSDCTLCSTSREMVSAKASSAPNLPRRDPKEVVLQGNGEKPATIQSLTTDAQQHYTAEKPSINTDVITKNENCNKSSQRASSSYTAAKPTGSSDVITQNENCNKSSIKESSSITTAVKPTDKEDASAQNENCNKLFEKKSSNTVMVEKSSGYTNMVDDIKDISNVTVSAVPVNGNERTMDRDRGKSKKKSLQDSDPELNSLYDYESNQNVSSNNRSTEEDSLLEGEIWGEFSYLPTDSSAMSTSGVGYFTVASHFGDESLSNSSLQLARINLSVDSDVEQISDARDSFLGSKDNKLRDVDGHDNLQGFNRAGDTDISQEEIFGDVDNKSENANENMTADASGLCESLNDASIQLSRYYYDEDDDTQ